MKNQRGLSCLKFPVSHFSLRGGKPHKPHFVHNQFGLSCLKFPVSHFSLRGGKSHKPHFVHNQFGLSLIEVCVTICVAGILAGVGAVQYGKYMNKAELQNLHDSVRNFATAVNACVQSSRGWHISLLKSDGDLCDEEADNCTETYDDAGTNQHGANHYPCKVTGDGNNNTNATALNKDLKDKLNYDCPITEPDTDNKCKIILGAEDTTTNKQAFCLSVQKEISGDKHQILVIIDTENTNKYQIYCRKNTTSEPVDASKCKIQDDNNTTYSAWNKSNTNCQCEWPVPSDSTVKSPDPCSNGGGGGGGGGGGNG